MNTIAQYESLSGMLTTMIRAAEQGDWEQVAGMESSFKPIIDQIRSTTAEERLSDDERRQKIQVIKQILRDDARLRELVSIHREKSAAGLVNAIETALKAHIGETAPFDDITLMALKRL